MNKKEIEKILQQFKSGQIEIKEVLEKLKHFPYDDLGFAKIDSQRQLRKGFPEVIFCQGKTLEQISKIAKRIKETKGKIVATRAVPEIYQEIKKIIVAVEEKKKVSSKFILVVSGGTADIPVAEEAAVIAELMGNRVERLYDVGVAGLHRLLTNSKKLLAANVLIVVAGMEGQTYNCRPHQYRLRGEF
jgi:NCAIR mutase (PurE)-related protein